MASIIVPATKSITVSSKFPSKSFRKKIVSVGFKNKYMWYSFLFFDISFVASDCVQSAILTLFKTSDSFLTRGIEFYIMPLLNPFSSVTTYNDCKNFDLELAVQFCPVVKDVTVQIDITTIVKKWLNYTLPNCGLVIIGYRMNPHTSGYISFGSAYSKNNTLIPAINVNYKQNIFCLIPPPPGLTYTTKLIESKK